MDAIKQARKALLKAYPGTPPLLLTGISTFETIIKFFWNTEKLEIDMKAFNNGKLSPPNRFVKWYTSPELSDPNSGKDGDGKYTMTAKISLPNIHLPRTLEFRSKKIVTKDPKTKQTSTKTYPPTIETAHPKLPKQRVVLRGLLLIPKQGVQKPNKATDIEEVQLWGKDKNTGKDITWSESPLNR